MDEERHRAGSDPLLRAVTLDRLGLGAIRRDADVIVITEGEHNGAQPTSGLKCVRRPEGREAIQRKAADNRL